MKIIPAGEFKAKCLQIMDEVDVKHTIFLITKHGKPVARLVPVENNKTKSAFGCLKNTVNYEKDILKPINEKWEADE